MKNINSGIFLDLSPNFRSLNFKNCTARTVPPQKYSPSILQFLHPSRAEAFLWIHFCIMTEKKTQLHLTIIFELEEVREEMVEGNCMIQAKFSL